MRSMLFFAVLFATAAAAQDAKPEAQQAAAPQTESKPMLVTEAHQADPSLPTWAPAAMRAAENQTMPGRVIAVAPQISLMLPEDWRADDVVATEVLPEQASALHALAQSGLIIDLVDGDKRERLLTFYRAPLKPFRELANSGKATGRIVITDPEYAYVVERGDNGKSARFKALRSNAEAVISTMAIYDERREILERRMPISTHYAGKLSNGQPIDIQFATDGTLTLAWGENLSRKAKGQWLQRDSQLMMQLFDTEPKPEGPVMMLFDGQQLTVTKWDEILFGATNVSLQPVK